MNTFKVGALVKRTSKGFPEYGIVEGNVYTVLDVKDSEEDEYADICLEEDPERWYDKRNFKLYTLEPTEDLQSELTEALAKIDTLESALEDAVRELISLREGNNTADIDVDDSEFKAISEYTLEDWEAAKGDKWVFELNNGREVFVKGIMEEFDSEDFPVELSYLGEGTHAGIVTVDGYFYEGNPTHHSSVKQRIK